MSGFHALLLGIVQGLTEFIPVSSSGHLVIAPLVLGWKEQPLVFDVVLHLGTSLALLVYFAQDIIHILKKDRKMIGYLIVGSIPAGLLGVVLGDVIESAFRGMVSVAAFLIIGSFIMYLADNSYKYGFAQKLKHMLGKDMTMYKAFVIGIFQSFALFPGVSRSGSSISAGMLFGLSREQAARFSFLLSIPVILGAGVLKVSEAYKQLEYISFSAVFLGFMASFLAGVFAINFLLKYLKNNSLKIFIIYRCILAAILLIVYFGIIV